VEGGAEDTGHIQTPVSTANMKELAKEANPASEAISYNLISHCFRFISASNFWIWHIFLFFFAKRLSKMKNLYSLGFFIIVESFS